MEPAATFEEWLKNPERGFVQPNSQVLSPELPVSVTPGGGVIPHAVGGDPVNEAITVLSTHLGVPPEALSAAIEKHAPKTDDTQQLYDEVSAQPDLPLTDAVVKPAAPPVPLAPPIPPEGPLSDPTKLLQDPATIAQQEQDAATKGPSSITNQDQGLTGQLDQPTPDNLFTPKTSPDAVSQPVQGAQIDLSKSVVPTQPSFVSKLATETTNQARQVGSGVLSTATAMPFDAAAALASLVAIPSRAAGWEGPANLVQTLRGEADKMRQGADFATGAKAPVTPGQYLARAIGKNASPNAPMMIGMTGADLLSQAITPTPAYSMDKATAEQLLFPQGKPQPLAGPIVTHTVPTAGGPAKVSDGDLKLMGFMGALSIGAIFAPSVLSRINNTVLPRFNLNAPRDVANAAPGTQAISNRLDLARTYDDVNAGIMRVARRAGVDPLALARVSDTFNIQTGSASRNLINSAVLNGRMETPTFSFKVNTPVAELAKQDSKPLRDYMHARDTFDDIVQREQTIQNKGNNAVIAQAAIGPVTIRGMTKQDALNIVNALEKTNPEVKDLAQAFRENVKAERQFLANGQYATMTKKENTRLNRESQNYVPWTDETGRKRVFDEPVERLSPFDALKNEMQATMRHRMENEAKGLYIDEMKKVFPNSFVKITPDEFKNNAHYEQNTVTMYRNGKLERYTTDPFIADVLNHDPYAVSGTIAQGLYATKRLMESTATGVLAPWFASTSALRSYQIGKITTPEGLKPPTFVGMVRSLPDQLVPQLAKSIASSLNNGSGGWLGTVLGPTATNALSTKLADVYDRSFYAQLEHAGTHQGSFLQHNKDFLTAIDKALGQTSGAARSFLYGYKQLLNAVHNSPSFDFAVRNRGALPLPKLAEEARHLTGDPLRAGQFLVDGKRPIRLDKPLLGSEMAGQASTMATQGYGFLTGLGREAVPWWNITTQGMKRIGQSYVENPTKFVAKTWTYQAMPAAALWLYSRGIGDDPSGKSYSDYQMRGRSEYNKLMNWYIPVPGRNAEDGIEVPRFHELAPIAHLMEVALDHVARSDTYKSGEDFMRTALSFVGAKDTFPANNGGAIFTPGQDLSTLGKTFAGAAIVPPTPPIASAFLASQGMVAPQGMFGGEAYVKKQDPYDQLGGMNASVELMARALGTGMADVIGSGYAAYTQTPEGVMKGVQNAMTEGGKRMIMKTPIARDLFDVKPPMTGNTDITEQLFAKEKVINNLSRYYRVWSRDAGEINTKMASERGGQVVQTLLGNGPPSQSAGLDQPVPTNPLYVAFMDEVYNKFNKDSPDRKVDPISGNKSNKKDAIWVPDDEGGIGAKSLWRRYGDYSTQLKRLRQINDGNNTTWQLQLGQRPEQIQYLKDNHVDYKDVRTVRNFYEAKRQEVSRQILFTIRAVEEDFSRRMGKPFKIEDLDPYAKGPQAGEIPSQQPTIPPWTDGTGGALQ